MNELSARLTVRQLQAKLSGAEQLQAQLSGPAQLSALLTSGGVILNDYVLGVQTIEGGHRLVIMRGNDVQTMDIMNGSLTDADREQIVNDVLAALPAAEGVKY